LLATAKGPVQSAKVFRLRGKAMSGIAFLLAGTGAEQANDLASSQEHSLGNKPILRTLSFAIVVAISYFIGTRVGFALTPSDRPNAAFWPPNAILFAVLLLAPTRMWWAFLLAVFPAHMFAQAQAGVPPWTAAGWFISNTGEALIGAWCITRYSKGKMLFDSVRGVLVFLVFGVVLAPLVTSFLDPAVVVSTGWGRGYWKLGTTRFFTNILAELTLVPTIVMWGSHGVTWIRKATLVRCLEAGLLVVGIVTVSFLIFGSQSALPGNIPALMYAPLPLLLWAAVRFGSGGLSLCLLFMALISIWDAMKGRGPFTSASMADNVLSLQVLLCMVGLPLLFLTALIEERRRTEESLRHTTGRLIDAQEQERRRIACELHDDLGQQIAMVQVDCEELRMECDASLKPRLTDLLNQLSAISSAAHDISHGLHPSQLEHLGLATAVKRLCTEVGHGKSLSIHQTVGELPERLQPTISLALYRVVQEALHNIVTHSRASKARVALRKDGGRMFLLIVDDGIGFALREEPIEGLGLASMRERIRSIGGSIDVKSSPMKGTRIEISVPLREVTSIEVPGAP
jgi:signal transduction histidine kinase